jgi:DNA-binding NarL/FixJ family response regulator
MSQNGYTALLVDDVRELRALLRLSLELSGRFHVVGEAEDGIEAVECAEKHRPDLVVLDISMPRRDGIEALPLLRDASPRSTVVVLSALDERKLGAVALERGASAYIEKGVDPDAIVERLVAVMESR